MNGGATFPLTIFDRDSLTLPTAPATTRSFVPSGTSQWQTFRYPLDAVLSVKVNSASVAQEYSLYQNYPNPFNPTTVISYQLPVASSVRLVVYDMLGREVTELANGRMSAGEHKATFSADGLSSGVYFCRLVAGDFVSTRVMTLLR